MPSQAIPKFGSRNGRSCLPCANILAECVPGPSAGASESKTALAVFFEARQ